MEELSIKIKISDRIYPMKVAATDEAFVRQAGKQMEDRIREYKTKLRINDQQDLLAMVGFDCLVAKIKMESGIVAMEKKYVATLDSVVEKIDGVINEEMGS